MFQAFNLSLFLGQHVYLTKASILKTSNPQGLGLDLSTIKLIRSYHHLIRFLLGGPLILGIEHLWRIDTTFSRKKRRYLAGSYSSHNFDLWKYYNLLKPLLSTYPSVNSTTHNIGFIHFSLFKTR